MKSRFCILLSSVFCLLTSLPSSAATRTVAPGASITDQVRLAAAGDTILIPAGRWVENVNLGSATGLTLRSLGGAVVAGRITGGTKITLSGLVIENASSGYQQGAVQLGDGSTITGCVIRNNESAAVFLSSNSILENSQVLDNGYLGVLSWPNAACVNVTIRGNTVARNNRGWPGVKPSWADYKTTGMSSNLGFQRNVDAAGKIVASGGTVKWFANPAWEAGGIKCAYIASGLRIENNLVIDNGGAGIWLDVAVRNAVISGNECYGQRGITEGWQGPGGWDEICNGPNVWENNYFHGNQGGGLILMETQGASVRNNVFSGGNGIGFRDGFSGQRLGWLKNISITGNQFYGTGTISAAPAGRNITQSGNQLALAGSPTWTRPGSVVTPPVVPPVVPPVTPPVVPPVTPPTTTTAPSTVPAPEIPRVVEVKDLGVIRRLQLRYSDGKIEEIQIPAQ